MFGAIVVGTDGSDTAKEAVRQATDLAKQVDELDHMNLHRRCGQEP